jgi:hypothetical protein
VSPEEVAFFFWLVVLDERRLWGMEEGTIVTNRLLRLSPENENEERSIQIGETRITRQTLYNPTILPI